GFADFIHQAVFVIDAAGPEALKVVFKRFRLADAAKGILSGFTDKPRQPFEEFRILRSPGCEVREGIALKGHRSHRNGCWSGTMRLRLCSMSSIAFRRRSRLAGERRRYSVSSASQTAISICLCLKAVFRLSR